MDYEKAFDSVQTQAILTSLQEQGIEDVYIEILKDIYTDSSVTVHLHKESEKIRIKRGVRQGDTISPKLFTATLENIFRRLNWENKGVKIDGEFLSNLRFADDIFLCTETPQELQHMLQELSDESRRMGLKMNITKTKVMVVDNTPINVNNVLIENVPGYVYLGQHYILNEKNQDKEIQRRIMAGWAAYAKHRDIFKSNLAICLKRQVYNSCVLPAMTYGAETWTLTKQAQNKLAAAQTKMERSMLNITYKDRRSNIWVRERTKLIDIIYTVRKMKWSWAGHINRLKDDRWTSRVTTWRPYDKKRRQGRPAKRWRDDLDKYWIWQRTAQDRVIWRRHAEAFAQPRDTTAAKLSLVISRLDFGNATLYGISETLLHGLQVVQNSAARLIMRVRKREHITPILFALHWLPVRQRIQYKILTLVYRCLNQQAPTYLSTCITPYVPGRSLRSSDHGLLTEHRYRLERYGRRCFTVAGPALWNELPTPVEDCQSYPSFKATLNTHLFRQACRDLV